MKELYRYSLKEATRLREIGKWRESHKENVRCRDEIDRLVSDNFDGMHLNGEIIKEICSEFGIDRTQWVLANTVKELDGDGRFRPDTKEWAKQIRILPDEHNTLTYSDGHMEKLKEHFHFPQHAVDIVKRLLHHSGMIIDNATPIAQGHLPNNTRITALKSPIVDEDCGIAVSIRLLHPQRVDWKCLIDSGMATEEMIEFLEMCIRYGISLVVAGRTSSGKTTLLNALLASIPDDKRIYSIESGARELFLVKRNRLGEVQNNVVHTLSRPSENGAYNISQEALVVAALRFDPDIVVIGEIRDAEANSAVEASLTGHTVVTTVHSGPAESAHGRISLLCQRRFQLGMEVALAQSRQAFPLVVFAHKCEDNSRKIMDISECAVTPDGRTEYRCLYRYQITKNECDNGKYRMEGHFERVNSPSPHLQMLLTRSGVPQNTLNQFLGKAGDEK